MRHVSAESTRELGLVVGIDPGIVLPTRHRDVRQPLVDQLFARALGVDMNQNASSSLPLAAVAGDRVPVVQMAALAWLERRRSTGVPLNVHARLPVDALDCAELAVRDAALTI